MKKLFIFGLMTILAACSSDKGNGLNDGWMNYRDNGVPTNNNAITPMVQNEKLNLADADFALSNNDADFGKNMKFSLSDNGVVTAIKFADATGSNTGTDDAKYKTYVRSGNSTIFRSSSGDDIKKISIGSGGNLSDKNALQYSDFGTIVFGNDAKNMYYATYTGGYKSKEIKNPDVNGMSFSGAAKGYVYGRDDDVLLVSGDATLSADGKSFEAKFNNWYTVNVNDDVMTFKDYKFGQNNTDKDPDKYKDPNKDKDLDNYKFRNESDGEMKFSATYYGDNNTPSEVVGSFGYTENFVPTKDDTGSAVRLDAAFGGVKK